MALLYVTALALPALRVTYSAYLDVQLGIDASMHMLRGIECLVLAFFDRGGSIAVVASNLGLFTALGLGLRGQRASAIGGAVASGALGFATVAWYVLTRTATEGRSSLDALAHSLLPGTWIWLSAYAYVASRSASLRHASND